ncbi:uncharacterized protein N7483_002363 [Penicillium malachiteum]|uniref:uncharacterized protein n=1 Tax=Penicillium malachiteum TaxID=1324776 RepID=UPI002546B23E|nr:uncharacterized protein N7483_002363 [Penicillium malachiteum]KAJ5737238.1 hypothetical protein N7483_002363 [Penicillium malachiteum]
MGTSLDPKTGFLVLNNVSIAARGDKIRSMQPTRKAIHNTDEVHVSLCQPCQPCQPCLVDVTSPSMGSHIEDEPGRRGPKANNKMETNQ